MMNEKMWRNPRQEKSLDGAQSPLWFWNDRLKKDELLRQLELHTQAGVRCTIPHARTNNGEGYIGGYLDEEWFAHIRTVLEYKKAHDEPVWMYDEMDWPAGTCNRTVTRDEQNREQYLTFRRQNIPAGTSFRAQLKDLFGRPLRQLNEQADIGDYAFNIFIVDAETQALLDITRYFKPLIFGPELEFKAERDAVAYIAKIRVDAYEYGGSNQVNYLDKGATKAFIDSTYEKYFEHFPEYFNSDIQCFFNDETRMCNALPWSRDFRRSFREIKGYDLMPQLVNLVLPGEKAGRTRCDYFDVLAYLYQENYFGEIHRWCQKHNTKLFAHLLGEETLYGHVRYSGDYLRQNKYLDIPGADHLGKGIGSLNIKYTSSGAHSYGHKLTGVEVFAGCGWDLTFKEYIRMILWLYQQGMQIIINHGFFYSTRGKRKDDWPPSQFFQWQEWQRMEEGNEIVRRLHYALTGGMNEMDVLVYCPTESMWLNYEPNPDFTHGYAKGAYLKNETAAKIDHEMQCLLRGLLSENLDFELLHKDAVSNFKVQDGKIINCLTGQSFSVLLLPMCRVLPIEGAGLCLEFVKSGGQLIFLEETPVYAMPQDKDPLLQEIMTELKQSGHVHLLPIKNKHDIYETIRKYIPLPVEIINGKSKVEFLHPCYPDYLIDPYLHNGEDLSGVQMTRYIKDGRRNAFFVNYGSEEEVLTVKMASLCEPKIWDVITGTVKNAKVLETGDDYYIVELVLPGNHGAMLIEEAK